MRAYGGGFIGARLALVDSFNGGGSMFLLFNVHFNKIWLYLDNYLKGIFFSHQNLYFTSLFAGFSLTYVVTNIMARIYIEKKIDKAYVCEDEEYIGIKKFTNDLKNIPRVYSLD
ncbi:hypothetical protein ACJX0J_026822 [Zea mays]